jgi:hypothetical protein
MQDERELGWKKMCEIEEIRDFGVKVGLLPS